MSTIRKSFALAAVSALLTLTAACGGDKVAICTDATKAITDWSSAAAASAGNLDGINTATTDLTTKLKDLSGKADGDLKASLEKLTESLGAFKIDSADPAGAAAKLTDFSKKMSEAGQELATACS